MAYQQDFLEEDSEQKKQEQSSPEQVISSGSGSFDTSTASTPSPSKTGSGFTNLSQYVDANTEQSREMAGKVTSGIDTNANDALTGIEGLKTEGSRVAAENTKTDQGVLGGLQNTPEQFAAKEWQDKYNNQMKGYEGPQDVTALMPYQDLSSKISKTEQQAKSLDDNAAIGQTIRDTYKNPSRTYTAGENTLDSFLTTSGAGADTLNQFKDDYKQKDLTGKFSGAQADVNSQLGNAKATSNDTQNKTREAYGASLSNIQKTFDQHIGQAKAEKDAVAQQAQLAQQQLASSNEAAFQQAGLDKSAAEFLKANKYDLSKLVKEPTNFRSAGDLTSDKEIEGYNALLGLNPGAQSAYDLSRTGNSAPSLQFQGVNEANQASALDQLLRGKLASAQAQRNSDYTKMQEAADYLSSDFGMSSNDPRLSSYSSSLGLTPDELSFIKDNLSHSINQADFLSKGKSLNLGDIASESDRDTLNGLLNSLGLSGSGYADTQDEGGAYNYDSKVLKNAIDAYKANDAMRQSQAPVGSNGNGSKGVFDQMASVTGKLPSTAIGTKVADTAKKQIEKLGFRF